MNKDLPVIGLLGSGYGLYGYLPAIVSEGYIAALPKRYYQKLQDRQELLPYKSRISFFENEEEMISGVNTLVVAKRPSDQVLIINSLLDSEKRLLLEKPLAPTIESYTNLIDGLKVNNTSFSVGYLFEFTPWARSITELAKTKTFLEANLEWTVVPNSRTWKVNPESGGGLTMYYAVHILPLLYALGNLIEIDYSEFKVSTENYFQTFFCNYSNYTMVLKVTISLGGKNAFHFSIQSDEPKNNYQYDASSPFGYENRDGQIDNRVSFLRQYLSKYLENTSSNYKELKIEESLLSWLISMNR